MALATAGQTRHFLVRYEENAEPAALPVANALLATCEVDLAKLSTSMPYMSGGLGDMFLEPKIGIQVDSTQTGGPAPGGADNFGHSVGQPSLIRINPLNNVGGVLVQLTDDYAGFLFVAEMAEILMSLYGWDAGSSQGEALSRIMAEELHPASSGNFVNTWLGWPRPRPDWISRNEPAGGAFVRGDLDPLAYGCGILFIYYLRYQLGFSYNAICGAGGTLLSDRYRNLTGATDDPFTRLTALLDEHFGPGSVNLVGNNPFPLLESADRRVFLAFSGSQHSFSLPDAGFAHLQPFVNCPAKDYPYTEVGTNFTQTITATTLGFGKPVFDWRMNGQQLTGDAATDETVPCDVEVPNPQNADKPAKQSSAFGFDYSIKQTVLASGTSSALTLTTRSVDGTFRPDVQVDVDEAIAPHGAVSAKQSLEFTTRTVEYGGTYEADRKTCVRSFETGVLGKVPIAKDLLKRLQRLPDPPDTGNLQTVIDVVQTIREELTRTAESDHATATQIARYAAMKTGLAPNTFLAGAGPTVAIPR